MTASGSSTVTASAAEDVVVTPYDHPTGAIYRCEFGRGHVVRLEPDAAESLSRQLSAWLAVAEANAREAAKSPLPADPTETLADRLTTEFLHDVAEGRQP